MDRELNEEGFPMNAGIPDPKPLRMRLSRRKGFDLQAQSRSINGLDAVNCARPHLFGNPFIANPNMKPGRRQGPTYFFVETIEEAVETFREFMTCEGASADAFRAALPELRGKNLACWCKLGDPCHADVLLELANK